MIQVKSVETRPAEIELVDAKPESAIDVLEERLSRGAELLFDMERRGDTDGTYQRYLDHYVSLLAHYEKLKVA